MSLIDIPRFAKRMRLIDASNIRKSGEAFANWEARFKNASMAMDVLTSNTCLMLVASEPWVGKWGMRAARG